MWVDNYQFTTLQILPKMELFLECPNQHKRMQEVGGKVEEFITTNYIMMQHSWKNFLIWYSARKYMTNIYFWLRIFKNKSLIGGSLLKTVLILAGNWTQVTFSGIIPVDHQDFCRYCLDTILYCPMNKIRLLISYICRHKNRNFPGKGRFLEIRAVRYTAENFEAFCPKILLKLYFEW